MTAYLYRTLLCLLAVVVDISSCDDFVSPGLRQYHLKGEANDSAVDITVTSRFLGPTFSWSAASTTSPTQENTFGCQFTQPSTGPNGSSYELAFTFKFDTAETTSDRLVIDSYEVLAEHLRTLDWTFDGSRDTLAQVRYIEKDVTNGPKYFSTLFADPGLNAANSVSISSVEFATDSYQGAGLVVSGVFDAVLGDLDPNTDTTITLSHCTFQGFWQIRMPR